MLVKLLPKRTDPNDPSRPQYLDESAHEVPGIALGNAAREALRLADMLQSLIGMARASVLQDNRHRNAHARYISNAINRLERLITTYVATLDQDALNSADHRRRDEILVFSANIAHAASLITNGLLVHAAGVFKKGRSFTPKQATELTTMLDRLIRNQRQAAALFVAEDVRSAKFLAFEKDHFRELEANAAEQHLENIKLGRLDAAELGSFYLDILRDIKTVNSYLIEASAYPILAKNNELLPNRLRDSESLTE